MTKNDFYRTVLSFNKVDLIKMDIHCNFNVVGSHRTYRIKPGPISFGVERKMDNDDWYNLFYGKTLYYKNMTSEKFIEFCKKLITLSNTEPKKKVTT